MKEAMDKLVQMTITRSVVKFVDPNSPTTKYLIQQGFIEPCLGNYKLTQRGVDEANRYAEGQKAIIEGESHE